jgi:sodium-dependent dicarboxylate transporter 2/3/5
MSTSAAKLDRSLAVKWAITIALAAIFWFFPTTDVYTFQVKVFLSSTTFFLAAMAFELVNTLLIAIMMPMIWLAFGVAESKVIFSPWIGTLMPMIIGAYFMAMSLETSGVLTRIAYYLLAKVKGNYMALLYSVFFITLLMGIFTSGRGYIVMAPLAMGLCGALGVMEKKAGAAIAMAVMVGGCTSHCYTYQSSMWGVITKSSNDILQLSDITPWTLAVNCWPMFVVSLLIMFLIGKWYQPEDPLPQVAYAEEQLKEMGPLTKREKWNAVMMILVVLYTFTVKIHHLDISYGFAILPWMVFIPGIDAADKETIQKTSAGMPLFLFIASCMGIGTVATSLGLGQVMIGAMQTLLNGSTNVFMIMLVIFAIVFVLNFLMTPLAIFGMVTGPILTMVTSMGLPALPFAFAIGACSEAIILPYEYVPYLTVFAFGMITMKDFIKLNILRSIVFFAGYLVILIPYWMLIGLV